MTVASAERAPLFGVRPAGRRWPAVAGVLAVCLYFLVAHGCHGDDADHELLLMPAKQIETSK